VRDAVRHVAKFREIDLSEELEKFEKDKKLIIK